MKKGDRDGERKVFSGKLGEIFTTEREGEVKKMFVVSPLMVPGVLPLDQGQGRHVGRTCGWDRGKEGKTDVRFRNSEYLFKKRERESVVTYLRNLT